MSALQDFIERWRTSEAAERANYQLFLTQLCDVLELPEPEPTRANDSDNAYVFERRVPFQHANGQGSWNFIDLYRRGCFVLEAKQGSSATVETPLFGLTGGAGRRGTARH